MSELKKYTDNDPDETCPFCGRVYPGEEEVQYEDWWAATECEHKCCLECSRLDSGCIPSAPNATRRKVSETENRPDVSRQDFLPACSSRRRAKYTGTTALPAAEHPLSSPLCSPCRRLLDGGVLRLANPPSTE